MRFLRPELHVQLNSSDSRIVDEAEAAIEEASEQARQHWNAIRAQMPADVVQFAEEYLLHDSTVFGPAWETRSPDAPEEGEVVLVALMKGTLDPQHENNLIFLRYQVSEEPTIEVPVVSDVFSRFQSLWLWDEFEVIEPGHFAHSILLTDGREITIRFRSFRYSVAPLVHPNLRLGRAGRAEPRKAPGIGAGASIGI